MTNEEIFNEILLAVQNCQKKITLADIPELIRKNDKRRIIATQKYRKYYLAHKKERDAYHKTYRINHPEYEEKRRERARKKN